MAISSVSTLMGSGNSSNLFSKAYIGQVSVRGEAVEAVENRQAGDYAIGPRISLFDGIGSYLTTQPAIDSLRAYSQSRSSIPVDLNSRSTAPLGSLQRLDAVTGQLQRTLGDLMDGTTLNPNRATSTFGGVQATASVLAQPGTYRLTVMQPGRGQQIASDSQTDATSALGLQGDLVLQGQTVSINETDSLADIASSINDTFADTGKVTARIDSENRLLLRGTADYPYRLQIEDPDSIGQSLGLVETNESGRLVAANELIAPQQTRIATENGEFSYSGNRIEDLFPGLTLELNPDAFLRSEDILGNPVEQPFQVEIQVERDTTQPMQQILRWVNDYNDTLEVFNAENIFPGPLNEDRGIAAARTRLIRTADNPVPGNGDSETNLSVRDIGLEVIRSETRQISQLTLQRLALQGRGNTSGFGFATAGGDSGIARSLDRLGILSRDDGSLQVDKVQLEQSLDQSPELVSQILVESEQSVFPRMNQELDSIRDPGSGILARREALYSQLSQRQFDYVSDSQYTLFETEFQTLQFFQSDQISQILNLSEGYPTFTKADNE